MRNPARAVPGERGKADPKGKYVVDSEQFTVPPDPGGVRRGYSYAVVVLPSAEYLKYEQALDEAARRIRAGHEVRITRPDGSHMHHDEIAAVLDERKPGR